MYVDDLYNRASGWPEDYIKTYSYVVDVLYYDAAVSALSGVADGVL